MRHLFVYAAALALAIALPGAASAQQYPARTIRVVVGFAAGGATDLSARFIAQKLAETIGQQVVVDNRPGAASTLASELVARSAPDGYTLLLANATVSMPSLFAKLSFDVRKDLVPVSLVGYGPLVLVVHPSLPVKSTKELIVLARRKPGMLNYGTAGVGSMTHLGMALLVSMTNVEMVHIPYKGSVPASIGVITGEVQLIFSSPAAVMSQIREDRLRALAVSGTTRSAVLPDVPTLSEAGLTGYDATSGTDRHRPARPGPSSSAWAMKPRKRSRPPTSRSGSSIRVSSRPRAARNNSPPISIWRFPSGPGVIKAAGIPPQ